jgi:hypothetical protein
MSSLTWSAFEFPHSSDLGVKVYLPTVSESVNINIQGASVNCRFPGLRDLAIPRSTAGHLTPTRKVEMPIMAVVLTLLHAGISEELFKKH